MSPAEATLDAAVMQNALAGCAIGREIIVLPEVTSTNDVVRELGIGGAAEGVVVFGETQTAGRGQYGRSWHSPAGEGLWLSVLLRPTLLLNESSRLTNWLAQTIAATIAHEFAVHAEVKSPNDVLIRGRKVAGVLVEMVAQTGGYFATAGIGINVLQRQFPAELASTATSLRLEAQQPIARASFAISLLRALDRSYCYT